MAAPPPEVLILGPTTASQLADVICGIPGGQTWLIDNKYYSCEVSLSVHVLPSPLPDRCTAEALILVIDAGQESSFQVASAWAAETDIESVDVRLLVATGVDQLLPECVVSGGADDDVEVPRLPWLLSAMDWAAVNGFEYIEACTSDAALDRRLRLDGDVQGVQRVAEALGAHMWPNLTPKQPAQVAAPSRPAAAGLSSAGISDDSSTQAAHQQDEPHVDLAIPPAAGGAELASHGATIPDANGTSTSAALCANDPAAAAEPSGGTTQPLSNGNSTGLRHAASAHQPPPPLLSDEELTDDLEGQHLGIDAFDRLMADMSSARGRVGTLPDAERRQAAAALAMRFAAMMGDDTDEDGDDSDSSH